MIGDELVLADAAGGVAVHADEAGGGAVALIAAGLDVEGDGVGERRVVADGDLGDIGRELGAERVDGGERGGRAGGGGGCRRRSRGVVAVAGGGEEGERECRDGECELHAMRIRVQRRRRLTARVRLDDG